MIAPERHCARVGAGSPDNRRQTYRIESGNQEAGSGHEKGWDGLHSVVDRQVGGSPG